MLPLRYILNVHNNECRDIIIPALGMATGIIIPLAAFYWQYLEGKEKRETAVEISKSLR